MSALVLPSRRNPFGHNFGAQCKGGEMSLYKRGEIWCVKKWDGRRQVRLSTGCRDYAEAQRVAETLVVPVIMSPWRSMIMQELTREAPGLVLISCSAGRTVSAVE